MATHPLPPADLAELLPAYAQTARSLIDLAFTCTDDDLARPTSCPGWTVHDQLAHVAGLEASLIGRTDPPVQLPDYPWLTSDMARMIEPAVEVRRQRTREQLLADLSEVIGERILMLQGLDLSEGQELIGPFGPMPAEQVLGLRIIDTWCHEQDVREALGRPGNLDSAAAALFTSKVLSAMPGRAVRQAHLPVGTTVIVDCTGPVVGRSGFRIVEREDGSPFADALFSGTAPEGDGNQGSGGTVEPARVTSIWLSTEALTRRGAGRIAAADLHYTVEGDADIALRLLDAMAITP